MTLRASSILVLVTVAFSGASLVAQERFTLLASFVEHASGNPVETLTPADVTVTEDGASAKVVTVEPIVRSVKVQVLIDNGSGIGRNIAELRGALRTLVEGLPADTDTALVTTAPQPRFLVRPTKNREELLKGLDRLAPDSGSGRFTESLGEAAERANKEKDAFTVIIAVGTTSGDARIQDSDIQRTLEQVSRKPMLVHVVLYGGERSASGGVVQTDIGERVAQMTGGRYELVNNMSRYSTLLPELGAEVAKQLAGNTRQFRVTVQRADGKRGDLGKISVGSSTKKLAGLWRD